MNRNVSMGGKSLEHTILALETAVDELVVFDGKPIGWLTRAVLLAKQSMIESTSTV